MGRNSNSTSVSQAFWSLSFLKAQVLDFVCIPSKIYKDMALLTAAMTALNQAK